MAIIVCWGIDTAGALVSRERLADWRSARACGTDERLGMQSNVSKDVAVDGNGG
jgi:hypothetical protein